ncbi:glycoside hydrolase family 25 protein [Hymenobacter tenuis]
MPAENVDTNGQDNVRVATMWGLLTSAINFFLPSENEVTKDNIRRFLLHVAWHEGGFLKHRKQNPTGPGRSFFQFEPLRAKEAVAYAKQRQRTDNLLAELARVGNCSLAALEQAGVEIGPTWPADNLVHELLGGAKANDLFAIYLARIAFMAIPAPIGNSPALHAIYWADHWKRKFDTTGENTRVKLLVRFEQEAKAADRLLPALQLSLVESPHATAASLHEQAVYLRYLSQQFEAAAKLRTPASAVAIVATNDLPPGFTGIIDTSHHHAIDMAAVQKAGITAVIHKATEGLTFQDKRYEQRRQEAKVQGLLWGCYHYCSGADPVQQAEFFLRFAKPGKQDLIALDWEESTSGPNMTQEQVRQFVTTIKKRTGRWPLLYGGRLLRESVGKKPDPILANCPLWYSRYTSEPLGIPQQIWPTYTLWQYTDGIVGPEPRRTPGTSGADRNVFQGTTADLKRVWPWAKS